MAELKRETHTVDLSAEVDVLTYTYAGDAPIEVLARVDLGGGAHLLAGAGGQYSLNFYIDDVLLAPTSSVTVPAGKTSVVVASRPFPLEPGDVVRLTATGLAGDTLVDTVASLRDATPIRVGEVVGGGPVPVDHDYGGADALTFQTPAGLGIAGAVVTVYGRADYLAGRRGADFVVARARTGAGGRWAAPVMLEPGAYTLVFAKGAEYVPAVADLTVS